jgi:AAA domain
MMPTGPGTSKRVKEDEIGEPLEDQPSDAEENPQPDAASPQEPVVSPEMQAALAAGMQVMADPGNEPRLTREPPQRRRPLFGRPMLDVNDPKTRLMLDRYRPLSLHEIAKQKSPQWLISRHIPEKSLVELFGEYASCKSFLALSWAFSIASGKPWLGRKVQQGHVIYVYAEGTLGLRKRALAWCKENGLDDFPERFHAIPRAVDMRNPEALDYLALAIKLELKDEKPSLIVLDTLNRCFGGGEENSNKDMSEFIAGCDKLKEEFDATVLVVHHSGKDRAKGGRGASAFGSAMDVIFELVKDSRDRPLAVLRNNTSTTKPHKDSSPLPDLALEFADVELDIEPVEDDPHSTTSLVVRLANSDVLQGTKEAKSSKREYYLSLMLRSLMSFGEDGATNSVWLKDCEKVPESTFHKLIKQLVESGDVRRGESGRYFAVGADNDALMEEDLGAL